MDYILMFVKKLSGGGNGNLYLSYDRELKIVFVATAVILMVIVLKGKNKS